MSEHINGKVASSGSFLGHVRTAATELLAYGALGVALGGLSACSPNTQARRQPEFAVGDGDSLAGSIQAPTDLYCAYTDGKGQHTTNKGTTHVEMGKEGRVVCEKGDLSGGVSGLKQLTHSQLSQRVCESYKNMGVKNLECNLMPECPYENDKAKVIAGIRAKMLEQARQGQTPAEMAFWREKENAAQRTAFMTWCSGRTGITPVDGSGLTWGAAEDKDSVADALCARFVGKDSRSLVGPYLTPLDLVPAHLNRDPRIKAGMEAVVLRAAMYMDEPAHDRTVKIKSRKGIQDGGRRLAVVGEDATATRVVDVGKALDAHNKQVGLVEPHYPAWLRGVTKNLNDPAFLLDLLGVSPKSAKILQGQAEFRDRELLLGALARASKQGSFANAVLSLTSKNLLEDPDFLSEVIKVLGGLPREVFDRLPEAMQRDRWLRIAVHSFETEAGKRPQLELGTDTTFTPDERERIGELAKSGAMMDMSTSPYSVDLMARVLIDHFPDVYVSPDRLSKLPQPARQKAERVWTRAMSMLEADGDKFPFSAGTIKEFHQGSGEWGIQYPEKMGVDDMRTMAAIFRDKTKKPGKRPRALVITVDPTSIDPRYTVNIAGAYHRDKTQVLYYEAVTPGEVGMIIAQETSNGNAPVSGIMIRGALSKAMQDALPNALKGGAKDAVIFFHPANQSNGGGLPPGYSQSVAASLGTGDSLMVSQFAEAPGTQGVGVRMVGICSGTILVPVLVPRKPEPEKVDEAKLKAKVREEFAREDFPVEVMPKPQTQQPQSPQPQPQKFIREVQTRKTCPNGCEEVTIVTVTPVQQ